MSTTYIRSVDHSCRQIYLSKFWIDLENIMNIIRKCYPARRRSIDFIDVPFINYYYEIREFIGT